jgi:DNA-binding NtrC family response regulator
MKKNNDMTRTPPSQTRHALKSSVDRNVRALLVSPFDDDAEALKQIFGQNDWDLDEANTCKEALDFFTRDRVPIVICNPASPQGGWKELVSHLAPLPQPPRVFVISETADQAVALEVAEQAQGNLISKPFDHEDVSRRIRSAWLAWKRASEQSVRTAQANAEQA